MKRQNTKSPSQALCPIVTLQASQKPISVSASTNASSCQTVPLFDNRISINHEPEWLTTKQAADYLRISVGSLRNRTSYGAIPYFKLGRSNRYRLVDLRNLLLQAKGSFDGN